MASSSLNYPLLAIPAYYVFCVLPHAYAMTLLRNNGYKPSNANPKAALNPATVKGKVPEAIFQRYQRAENAQGNNLEQLPLFITAVLSSVFAEYMTPQGIKARALGQNPTGVETFVALFFASRVVYTVLYITISSHTTSLTRSAAYATGVYLMISQIYKAAVLLG